MARKPTPAPDIDDDLDLHDDDEPEQDQEPEGQAVEVEPLAATAADTHKQNVISASGTKQSAITSAFTTFASDHNQPNLVANVKNADIAFYQSLKASAIANGQPFGSAVEALRSLGVTI